MGICAAMPPMACTPRLWQVLISSRTYASMKGLVMVTSTLQANNQTVHIMWRVLISSRTYASMKGLLMVTSTLQANQHDF
jgi:hypothetical protein